VGNNDVRKFRKKMTTVMPFRDYLHAAHLRHRTTVTFRLYVTIMCSKHDLRHQVLMLDQKIIIAANDFGIEICAT
jgi:hypothetical protein